MSKTDDLDTGNAPAEGRWSFDNDVTESFEDMLERSIPNYQDMRKIVTDASAWLVDRIGFSTTRTPGVVDLGASRGSALAPLVDKIGARGRFLATEISPPMLEALHERFAGMIGAQVVEVREHDLRDGFPIWSYQPAVVLSVLTLQFVPLEYRQRLLREAYENLAHGGGLILVEKVQGTGFEADKLLVDLYWGLKREAGYTQEAVQRKALSLEGVLVPLTAPMNEQFLRGAGFELVECIWRWSNFAGWLAVKR